MPALPLAGDVHEQCCPAAHAPSEQRQDHLLYTHEEVGTALKVCISRKKKEREKSVHFEMIIQWSPSLQTSLKIKQK